MSQDSGSGFSPLIYTKVHIPRASNLLCRSRLLDFFHENIHRKLLLICAGPGYGKTSLLANFAHDTDLPVCWYTLDPSDRDPRTFLGYLVEAVRVRFPSFGGRTEALLQQGGGAAGNLRGLVGVLVNELAEEIPEYVVIVLDDYHVVDSEEGVNQVLDTLLQYLPENVHLIISGRSVPPLSMVRLATYGEAAAIGSEHLCFTTEEVRALLWQNFSLRLPEDEASRLVEESEGWITGILLRAQAGRQGTMGILSGVRTSRDHVYAYLADEVLRHLAPEVQDFARKISILNQVDAVFCDALLERHDSAQILAFLERHNLFLVSLDRGWYRFHSLFREFLLGQARADWDGFVRLNVGAARLWRERGEMVEMVEHLLQAQAYQEAAEEIAGLAQDLCERSRFRTLLRWVESLPEALCRERPQILLFQGKAYVVTGQGDRARASFLQAEGLFAQVSNVRGWIQAIADRGYLECARGNYHEALQIAREALARAQALNIPAILDLHRTIGMCLHALGDLAGAEEHFRAAVERAAGFGAYDQAATRLDLGFCLRAQGRIEEAETAYRQALEHCRTIGSPDLLANVLNNLAMGHFLRGELQEAQTLLQEALQAAQVSLSPRIQALVWASLGDVYRDLGDLSSSRQAYEKGSEQARLARDAALVAYLLEALGNLARQEGSFPEAHRYLQGALDAAGSSQREQTQARVSLALLEAAEGRTADALNLLEEAAARQEKTGWRLQLLRSWLVRAIVQSYRQRRREAREALRQAMVLAEELGVLEPFLAEGSELLPLLQRIPPASRGKLSQKLLAQLQARAVLREKVVSKEGGRPPLRIQALGPGRVFLGEKEISTGDWGYRLARELFFYLLFNSPARKGQIGLSFWPDQNAARVNGAFHAALYRARRATGYSFVVFQEDSYHWNPAVPYWCDVVEFERSLERAKNLPPGDPQAIELVQQAVSLYQGDFLEEFDRDWCAFRREELNGRYLEALVLLGRLYLDQHDSLRAQETFQRVLQVDNFLEEAYRGLMRSCIQAGERAAAVQVYRRCRRHLAQELHVEPSEETKALYRAIARGES
jgi:LuxR family maltose regulon positive regulatory protein